MRLKDAAALDAILARPGYGAREQSAKTAASAATPELPASESTAPTIWCADCGLQVTRVNPAQKYCAPCSEKRDLHRKRMWARENPPDARTMRERGTTSRSESIERGAVTSLEQRFSIGEAAPAPHFVRYIQIAFPFNYALSKNHIYTMRRQGHVALREEHKAFRTRIRDEFVLASKSAGFVHGKIWLDLLVEKPNHRGDAINVLDAVADALKKAMGIDDRWFAVRWIDWRIVKQEPQILVGIGQECTEPEQVCSYCGRILPLAAFYRKRTTLLGVSRECRECKTGKAAVSVQAGA